MKKRFFYILGFYLILTAIFTFPLVFKLKSYILGTYTSDEPFGWLSYFWWLKYAFQNHLPYTKYSVIAAPFGIDISSYIIYPFWNAFTKWLSVFVGYILSYNIQILFSFALSGVTMFYLAFAVTKDKISSLFSGVIYAFCPYHFARAWQHLSLAQIQWMPLYLLSLVKLKERPGYKNMFLSIGAIFLLASSELHYFYFAYIATGLFLVIYFIFCKKKSGDYLPFLKKTLVVIAAGIIFVIPAVANTVLKKAFLQKESIRPSAWSVVRPFDDLFAQSARPLSYFLPSTAHPVFGRFTESFIGTSIYGESLTEHTLYLGWIPLILAFVAFISWKRRKKLRVTSYELRVTDKEPFYIGFFAFLAIAAWLFSQPPWWEIGSIKIYMPSFFVYRLLPMFRASCRFGILVMLAIAVLSAFGLKFILEKFSDRRIRAIVICTFFSLLLFEFWNYPPLKVINVGRFPQVYYWLKEHPGYIIIAEYPLDAGSPNELYKFYQTLHEKKIINGSTPYSYANKVAKKIIKLSSQNTAGILKRIGVKYALVHREGYLETDLIEDREELDKIPKNKGLKFIRSFPAQECPDEGIMCVQKSGPIDVYEVIGEK